MSTIVIDASAAVRALSASEIGSGEARAVLGRLIAAGIEPVAPDVFPYEIGHATMRASGSDEARVAMLMRATLVTRLLHPTSEDRRATLRLARDHAISFYDAAYVIAARSEGAVLWTEDHELLEKFPDVAENTATIMARYA